MKIDEKIQEVKSKLVKVLTEPEGSRENLTQILEKMGLDREIAEKLIQTFIKAENAKNTVKDIWGSDTRIDYSIDVAEYQQQEIETRQNFDSILQDSSLLIVANTTDPNEINEELLQKLQEYGIVESQITSPALRITYHYYIESKSNEVEKNEETEKMRQLTSKVGNHAIFLKKRFLEIEEENKSLKSENDRLKKENTNLKISYRYIENKYKTRIVSNEKNYQSALEYIKTLKKEIRNLQNRGIFQTIGNKLFRGKRKELPAPTSEIPDTLYESFAEQIEATRNEDTLETKKGVAQPTTVERTDDSKELQQ